MQSTSLRFLCKDGAVSVQFTPALSPLQYAEVHDIVTREDTCEELTARLKAAANCWGVVVSVEAI
jgi:hypothetical protein